MVGRCPNGADTDNDIADFFQEELGGPCTVVATGGLSGLIAPLSETIDHHEPWLTLHGLRVIHEKNAGA